MSGQPHSGHRKRLDEKVIRFGFEFLEEHEQLEKILFVAIPQGDTNALAHRLLDKCGSLYGVLTADVEELLKVEGVGRRTAHFLHDLFPLLGCTERCMLRENQNPHPRLKTAEDRGKYVKSLFYGKLIENFYMVSLDKHLRAFRFDKIASGNSIEVPVYISEVVKLALRNNASYVILAHNHPGGNLNASADDIYITRNLSAGLRTVGIELLDHIIVSHGDFSSMKSLDII